MDAGPLRLVGVSGIRIVVCLEPLHERLPRAAGRPLQRDLAPPLLGARAAAVRFRAGRPVLLPLAPTPRPRLRTRHLHLARMARPHVARLGGPRAPDNAPEKSRVPRRRLGVPCRHRGARHRFRRRGAVQQYPAGLREYERAVHAPWRRVRLVVVRGGAS